MLMIKEQNKEIEQPFRPLTRRQTMEFESPFQMQQRERPRYDPVFVDNFQSDLVDDKPAEDTNELPRPKPMRRSITLEGLDFSDKLGGGKKVRKRKNKTKKKRKSRGPRVHLPPLRMGRGYPGAVLGGPGVDLGPPGVGRGYPGAAV